MPLISIWFSVNLIASATTATADNVSARDVLDDAKHRSVETCTEATHRCSYRVVSDTDGWWVLVVEAVERQDGSVDYPIGAHWGFHYTLNGKYLETFKGA